jgi:hypothetical protein
VAVSAAPGDQLLPVIATDGANGAIVAWTDVRSGDQEIFAQRMLGPGTPMWATDGVALTSVAGSIQSRPAIASDGAGGAIVAWEDDRNAADRRYVRRITSAGTPQWTANGVQVAATANATVPVVVPAGASGAIVVWTDERNGGGNTDVFAQRLDASGAPQWAVNGVTVCGAAGGQFFPYAISDGAGGALVGWEDARSDPNDVFGQRVSPTGAGLWTTDGRPISTAAGAQSGVTIAPDGSGGGIFSWVDARAAATGLDVFAAHVDGAGTLPVALETFTVE